MSYLDKLNDSIGESFVGKFFQIKERGSTFSTELAGATATFLTMAYILAVNPRILADSGGPCIPNEADGGIFGETYEICLEEIKRQYVTATALSSMVGTFLFCLRIVPALVAVASHALTVSGCLMMGLFANLPVALAPGMGTNAYFTYSVVGFRGTGNVSYESAVTAVAIEGAIFFVLAATGLRYKIIRLIPEPVRIATPAGIGAFLAHLGLQSAEGIGVVVGDIATAVTLGGCPPEKQTKLVAYDEACRVDGICITSDNYTCDVLGGTMQSGRTWLGILGLMIIAIATAYKSKLSFIFGIAFVTFISWFRDTVVTYFPDDEVGNDRFDYFKKVVDITGLNLILTPYTSNLANAGLALITFLYVDFLDTSGTLLAIVSSMGIIDEEGNFPKMTQAFCVDAGTTIFGSIFGLSPLSSYIESGAGVEAGARTGLTAVICGFYFFISIFFAPILASIPPWAVGGALIIVGALMARSLTKLNFNRVSHAVSGFLTVMVMPLTYSIAYGLLAGIGSFLVMEGTFWVLSCFGFKVPVDEEKADKLIIGESFMEITGGVGKEIKIVDDNVDSKESQDDFKEFLNMAMMGKQLNNDDDVPDAKISN